MEMTYLGDSGVRASRIGLGTWAIGGWMWGGTSQTEADATIHAALDQGITLIDTAPVYGFGASEEIVGHALADGRRNSAVIATKAGLDWPDQKPVRNSTPERLLKEFDDSLRRLRTDWIDLYQVHWPDPLVPLESTARALEKLYNQGKIRAVGLSNFSRLQTEAVRAVVPVHALQSPYNLFEREIESDVLPYARRTGLTVLGYGALCRGLLTGTVTADRRYQGDDLRKVDPKFREPQRSQYLAAVDALGKLSAERFGKSVAALAVRWVLEQGPTIALWGARKPAQLAPVEEVMSFQLDAATLRDIDEILARCVTDPVGPEFMAPPARPIAAPKPTAAGHPQRNRIHEQQRHPPPSSWSRKGGIRD